MELFLFFHEVAAAYWVKLSHGYSLEKSATSFCRQKSGPKCVF